MQRNTKPKSFSTEWNGRNNKLNENYIVSFACGFADSICGVCKVGNANERVCVCVYADRGCLALNQLNLMQRRCFVNLDEAIRIECFLSCWKTIGSCEWVEYWYEKRLRLFWWTIDRHWMRSLTHKTLWRIVTDYVCPSEKWFVPNDSRWLVAGDRW